MTDKKKSHAEELRGASRLAVDATKGITALVEEMHRTIASGPAVLGSPLAGPARLVTNLVYGGLRGATDLVGTGMDLALEQLAPHLGESASSPEREAVRAALNGVLGDHLEATNNPLAIDMRLRPSSHGEGANGKLLVVVHGSCMNDQQWRYRGHDHGAALAEELGYSPVYLHYNSGRHISKNGSDFAVLLEEFVKQWPSPIEDIVFLTHSMGGLVSRSACRVAENLSLDWRKKLSAMVFLGTPHHGAPLERGGNWIDVLLGVSSYTEPFVRLGKIRSVGVTDLRFGNVLDEHWQGRDRFEMGPDQRSPVPLPDGVACFAVAGVVLGGIAGELSGDGLVLVDSALGKHARPELTLAFPEAHKHTVEGVAHLDLLSNTEVYEKMSGWLRSTR